MKPVIGPMPSCVRLVCPDCGKVRWQHPSSQHSSERCKSCAKKKMWRDKRADAKGGACE